jgi:predicted nuclease of restriction endonuclease-like (RecB) superfamily
MNSIIDKDGYNTFLTEIKDRIRKAQYEALKSVNKELINLYWDIGRVIVERQEEYKWGKSVVENLADDLQNEYPGIKGFSARNLWNMRNFYVLYRDNQKLQPLVAEISWTKNLVIMEKCKDDLEREFYIRMTKKFGWTKNVLIHQIENKAYQQYLLNQTNFDKAVPEKYRSQAKLAVKDEYTFDFLELGEEHSEKELESELVNKIGSSVLSVGTILAYRNTFLYVSFQRRLESSFHATFLDSSLRWNDR